MVAALIALVPGQRRCATCQQVVDFDAYLANTWRCPDPTCGFRDLETAAVSDTRLLLYGQEVGRRTAQGSYLHRATFGHLSVAQKVLAYLLLVAPQPRRGRTLGALCGIAARDFPAYIANLVKQGQLRRPCRGMYQIAGGGRINELPLSAPKGE